MSKEQISMDLTDVIIVKDSIAEIEHIGRKYDLPARELIEKVFNLEKVKV